MEMSVDCTEDQSMAPVYTPAPDTDTDVVTSESRKITVSCGSDTGTYMHTHNDRGSVTTHGANTSHAQDTNTQSDTVASVAPSDNPSFPTRMRSRFGRIIKPVDRLIHTMSRQAISHTHPFMQSISRSLF